MVRPIQPSGSQGVPAATQADVGIKVLAHALRQKREEAEALVRLVEQATPSSDKGQHVNYYG